MADTSWKERVDAFVLDTLRNRGGTWGVYQNQALDSASAGHVKFLQYGEGKTYTEPPDFFPNEWKYVLIDTINAAEL